MRLTIACLLAAVALAQQDLPEVGRELRSSRSRSSRDPCRSSTSRLERDIASCSRRGQLDMARAIRDARRVTADFNDLHFNPDQLYTENDISQGDLTGVALAYFQDNNINDEFDVFIPEYRRRIPSECEEGLEEALDEWETCEENRKELANFVEWAWEDHPRDLDGSTPGTDPNDWWFCCSDNNILDVFCDCP